MDPSGLRAMIDMRSPPLLLLLLLPVRLSAQVAVTGCDQPGCIGCDQLGRCTRCTRAIVHGTRQCVTSCPGNYRLVHSDVTGYQGLLCRAARFLDSADLTTGELAALVAALLLAAVYIGLAIGAFMYLRLRSKMDPLKERLHRREPEPVDVERAEFAARLRALRPELGTLLRLLVEPRPASRHSAGTGRSSRHTLRTSRPSSADSQQDLRRLLTLLTGRQRQPPADWHRLLSWAERLLRRHRHRPGRKCRQGGGVSPQLEPLRSVTPGSRRPRTSAGGSLFSLARTVIQEEEAGSGRPARTRRRTRTDSAPGGLSAGPAVFVHRLNGGPSLRPATAEPRPTYRDWPPARPPQLSHRARPPLPVGSAAPLLWPPRPGEGRLYTDVLEQEGASFGGRYLHPQHLSTVL